MAEASYLYEIPLVFFILVVFQRAFFPDLPGYYDVAPHPYWIGILPFALRHGIKPGAASGVLAAALYLGSLWLSGERFLFEDADFYLLPGFFIIVGAVIGAVVDHAKARLAGAEAEAAARREEKEALAEELEVQKKTNSAIEQQVVSQMSSLVTLYQGARDLGALDKDALMQGILDFFTAALKADKTAIYLRSGDRWKLSRSKGWSGEDGFPQELEATQGVLGKAGSENRVVSIRDWFGSDVEKAWEGREKADAVMAAPLRRDTGEVIGVFGVQEIPLLRFNSAAVNLLTLLADWAEAAISKQFYFEELKSKLIQDEVFGVYNERYFKTRSEQEFSRSKTYSLPFSLLLVSVRNLRELPRDRQVNLLRALGRLLQDTGRDIDIVTKFPDPDIPFGVLMMTTPLNRAKELRQDILKAFKKLDLRAPDGGKGPEPAVGVGSFAPEMGSVEDLIAQARADLG